VERIEGGQRIGKRRDYRRMVGNPDLLSGK